MATKRFLLDTNILSSFIKEPAGAAARKIAEVGVDNVATSIVVAAELRFGVEKKGSQKLKDRVEALLESLEVLSLGPGADRCYAKIRWALEAEGRPIGPNDLLIAAHAISEGMVLVTRNAEEFERVAGLDLEVW